jgi:hypothetical protein
MLLAEYLGFERRLLDGLCGDFAGPTILMAKVSKESEAKGRKVEAGLIYRYWE